ncbi:LuxR family transcriptional regulator [Janthinobacterium violaceinigrum]|uniref:LuxR family transcriptional regulator n=1 Tax=Janthinobacterium violaceinigrum TaxID=2654252 RepID=A0A6I1IAK9_9BURK|nr:LuxR family transcriptional regulator [Janthinobacterium violaceinigrum]
MFAYNAPKTRIPAAEWKQGVIESLAATHTPDDIFEVLAGVAGDLGFEYCAYGLQGRLPMSNPKVFTVNNYPSSWQRRYSEQAYMRSDPTVSRANRSLQPILWGDKMVEENPEFWEDAHAHGLRYGWAQSSCDMSGQVGLLSFSRSSKPLTEREIDVLSFRVSWLANVVHEHFADAIAVPAKDAPKVQLTEREAEVLRWCADGKTSADISEILNITERTVTFHISNSLQKLDTVNKTAAVIKAMALRLL